MHWYCLVTIEWRVFFPLPINKHSGPTRSEEYKYHLINGELLQVSSTMAVMTGGGGKKKRAVNLSDRPMAISHPCQKNTPSEHYSHFYSISPYYFQEHPPHIHFVLGLPVAERDGTVNMVWVGRQGFNSLPGAFRMGSTPALLM